MTCEGVSDCLLTTTNRSQGASTLGKAYPWEGGGQLEDDLTAQQLRKRMGNPTAVSSIRQRFSSPDPAAINIILLQQGGSH